MSSRRRRIWSASGTSTSPAVPPADPPAAPEPDPAEHADRTALAISAWRKGNRGLKLASRGSRSCLRTERRTSTSSHDGGTSRHRLRRRRWAASQRGAAVSTPALNGPTPVGRLMRLRGWR